MAITTSSSIDYAGIDETFPVAGQDNDTQVLRDNFDTIKNSFRSAKNEINELLSASARTDTDNDFGLNLIQNVVFQQSREQKYPNTGTPMAFLSGTNIDWQLGSYQIWKLDEDTLMGFENLPGDPALTNESTPIGVGRLTLELYGNGTSHTLTFTTSGGATIKKDLGTWDGTVSSLTDPVILEVWRHSEGNIFIRYVGTFS